MPLNAEAGNLNLITCTVQCSDVGVCPKKKLELENLGRIPAFLSECAAYRIATAHPFLKSHVRTFYGKEVVTDVLGDGRSLGKYYLLDCCYRLEFIQGKAFNLAIANLSQDIFEFFSAGVRYLEDVSVFFFDDPQRFTLLTSVLFCFDLN